MAEAVAASEAKAESPKPNKTVVLIIVAISFISALCAALELIGATKTAAPLLTLLTQMAIPLNMAFSFVILGVRPGLGQMFGATLVIAGVLVVLSPEFRGEGFGEANSLMANFVFV